MKAPLFSLDRFQLALPIHANFSRADAKRLYKTRYIYAKSASAVAAVTQIITDRNRHNLIIDVNPSRLPEPNLPLSVQFQLIQDKVSELADCSVNLFDARIMHAECFRDIVTEKPYGDYYPILKALKSPYKRKVFCFNLSTYRKSQRSERVLYDKFGELSAKKGIYLNGLIPPENLMRLEYKLLSNCREFRKTKIVSVYDFVNRFTYLDDVLQDDLQYAFKAIKTRVPPDFLPQKTFDEKVLKLGREAGSICAAFFAMRAIEGAVTDEYDFARFLKNNRQIPSSTRHDNMERFRTIMQNREIMAVNGGKNKSSRMIDELEYKLLPPSHRGFNLNNSYDIDATLEATKESAA